MKHRILPAGGRDPRARYVWVLAPLLVLCLVGAIAWFSSGNGPGAGEVSAGSARVQEPPAETAAGSPSASTVPEEVGSGKDGTPRTAEAVGTSKAEQAKLDKSLRQFKAAQRRLAARVGKQLERRTQLDSRTQPLELRVATFNVLGDSHTGPGGNKAGFPDAGPRMDMTIATLRNNGIDVVGFQEFEASQHAMFSSRAGEYALYPGLTLGDKSVRFNIAWRTSMW